MNQHRFLDRDREVLRRHLRVRDRLHHARKSTVHVLYGIATLASGGLVAYLLIALHGVEAL
ncbi:hypothetical protein AAKU55_005924 [Oxalobacteraceae bacterium GrIS 1.11]